MFLVHFQKPKNKLYKRGILKMNLTELQINYILVDTLKGENRKENLIRIFQELENENLKHDNINKYILECGEY